MPYSAGRVFQRRFKVALREDKQDAVYKTAWKMENLGIVALVHKKTDKDFEVIQVNERLIRD